MNISGTKMKKKKNSSFQVKEFWKTCVCHLELHSFPVPGGFSDEVGVDVNKHEFLILCAETCQHLEEPCNSELAFSK